MPAAAAVRPYRQPALAGRAGSRRGLAVPTAAAGRAGSRGPTCAGQTIDRKLLSQGPVEKPAGNCISFRQPTLPEEGDGSGVGGRGGGGCVGITLSLPSEAHAVADLSPHALAAGH